jgi:predicted RNA-binding protein YlxR (DUF448 family)
LRNRRKPKPPKINRLEPEVGFAARGHRENVPDMLAIADPADLDGGPRTNRSATTRMCAVTRQVRPIGELIRFVVAPSGEVIADLKRRLPGRGLWISASHAAVAEAVRRHQFSRGFKREVRASASLADETGQALVRSAIEALAMVAKAGQVVAGFAKVEEALLRRQATALLHAADGAADGIRKLDAIVRKTAADSGETRDIPVITVLASAELDLALGRSNVIHAALLAGPASGTFLSRSQILVRYRDGGRRQDS